MVTTPAETSRTRYQSRPGRHAVVAASLTDLKGPAKGTVELPIWLFWYPDRTFDLEEPGSTEDLADLNGDMLIALWPELYLPKGVRQAWEDLHPELRPAASAPAA